MNKKLMKAQKLCKKIKIDLLALNEICDETTFGWISNYELRDQQIKEMEGIIILIDSVTEYVK